MATSTFCRTTEKAFIPTKGSKFSAGFDLCSAYPYIVKSKSKQLVKTDLKIQIPSGCYGRIAPRSGLAWNNFIHVGGGVIDVDYRGPINVILFNFHDTDFHINIGDRIAQLIFQKIEYTRLVEIKEKDFMEVCTERGENGFGSTGINMTSESSDTDSESDS
jgi:dUTP pyrophosphatase